MPLQRLAVVGASAAGLGVATELRRHGYVGAIDLIGDEDHLPYDRPPLSKQLLTGAWEADRLALTSAEQLDDLGVTIHLGRPAVGLDAASRTVLLEGGDRLEVDAVAIATGCVARTLPDAPDLDGVHTLRTLADSQRLRSELGAGRRLVVVGAGFLGMEIAAVARTAGASVTVISGGPPMVRAIGSAASRAVAELHIERGVELRIGSSVSGLVGTAGRVAGVSLADGSVVPADAVVLAIGAIPATGWLIDSGLTIDDGVVCDAGLRAADGVYAVGDVARWRDPRTGTLRRVEHRMHATESAAVAAANLLAQDGREREQYSPLPFWWSDQYDVRIQAYGWPGPQAFCWDGDLADRKAVLLYADGDRITGVLGFSSAKQVRAARELLLAGTPISSLDGVVPIA